MKCKKVFSKNSFWEEQWALFAENFREGKAHIDLTRFGGSQELRLIPGPGFGDLSHPTTYLMLDLMQGRIQNQSVLDIGCGSGILTLAALLLGASWAIGLDICTEAIAHARQNAELNGLAAQFFEAVPPNSEHTIALMNMITSEQRVVMQHELTAELWIVSGILVEQRAEYLALTKSWGWTFIEEKEREGWLGIIFQSRAKNDKTIQR